MNFNYSSDNFLIFHFVLQTKITPEKIFLLESINFDWEPYNSLWEKRFRELIQFKEEFGHTNVTRTYSNKCLGIWVRLCCHLFNLFALSR